MNIQSVRHCIVILLAVAFLSSQTNAEPFKLVSVSSTSSITGNADSLSPVISPDGRYVLFASAANNLVLIGTNAIALPFAAKMNVYLRDRSNGTTILVSVNVTGNGGGNADSLPAEISTNGQYALFESAATNLVAGDTNYVSKIFMRDLVHNTTSLVSIGTNGLFPNGNSRGSAMTPDGHYVAFTSEATNLVAGDTNRIADIFVRDIQLGTTTLASPGAHASTGTGSELPDITPDGRYVVFYSTATNLVGGGTNNSKIYVRDLTAQTTTLVSSQTVLTNFFKTTNTLCFNQTISDDGQFIAYESVSSNAPTTNGVILRFSQASGFTDIIATNAVGVQIGSELNHRNLDMTPDGRLVAYVAKTNGNSVIYVWDSQSGVSTLASVDTNNAVPALSTCDSPVLTPSGQFVAFTCTGTPLTTNSTASQFHIYIRDLIASTTQLVDTDTNGVASAFTPLTSPCVSTNGMLAAYESLDPTFSGSNSPSIYNVFIGNVASNSIELVSVAASNLVTFAGNGPSTLSIGSVSTNGRYVAFSSEARNLVAEDNNDFRDVFECDTVLGTNVLVSVDTNGIFSGNGISITPSVSGDGRYVAFTSTATNLVVGDNNGLSDVFVRDLQQGVTALVSVNTVGTGPGDHASSAPTISVDGRYVLFYSQSENLASGVTVPAQNLYWRDMQSGVTRIFGVNPSTTIAAVGSMSSDGQYVLEGATGSSSVYVWNAQLNSRIYTNTTVSAISGAGISPDGNHLGFFAQSGRVFAADRSSNTTVTLGNAPIGSHSGFRFSGDSRFMAYVGGDANKTNQIYLYDFLTQSNLLISQTFNSIAGGSGNSDSPDISSDGRFIAYRSVATNLVPAVNNGAPNVYLYDRTAGVTTLASISFLGNMAANGHSLAPVFSGDASTLFIESRAPDLSPNDINEFADIFSLSLYSGSVPPPFTVNLLFAGGSGYPVLVWTVLPGKTYEVQYKNDLSDANWITLNGQTTIEGTQASLTDTSATGSQRFYRVVGF
jgi:Tol biopolymer transport system component